MSAPVVPLDRIALTVGVTGHPDVSPEAEAQLRPEFETILGDLAQRYEHSPIVVLSPLAPGAETLAAEVAQSLDIAVVACLPAASAVYELSLRPEERARFRAVLARCARVDVASSASDRTARSLDAGTYVAHYSHVVIAFWDGGPGADDDPTGHIAEVRVPTSFGAEGSRASLAEQPDLGPVYQITTPRGGAPAPVTAAPVLKHFPKRFPADDQFEADFTASLERIDRCNRDLEVSGPPAGAARTIDELCDNTGKLSDRLQRTTFSFLYLLYAVAIVATAAQYTSIEALKYAMFPIAFIAYRLAKRFDYENRYQDYRALSEGLRVQSGWLGAGLREDQADACYLGMQEKELQWIRMALRYAHFAFRYSVVDGRVSGPGCAAWIDGQCAYFTRAPRREERSLRKLVWWRKITFASAISISALLFTYLYLPTGPENIADHLDRMALRSQAPATQTWLRADATYWTGVQAGWNSAAPEAAWITNIGAWNAAHPETHTWFVRLSTAVLALYAAIALLMSNYSDKRAFSQSARRYDRMFVVFDRAKRSLAVMVDKDGPAGRELVRELGRAALIENADWLLNRRDRPLAYVRSTPGQ